MAKKTGAAVHYLMQPSEQRAFDKLKAAFPMTMQTVVAVRVTSSQHWEALYTDGSWYLIVSHVGVGVHSGSGGLTHLGPDEEVSAILVSATRTEEGET